MRTPVVPAPQSLSDLTPLGACPQSVLPIPWSVQPSHLPFPCAWPLNQHRSQEGFSLDETSDGHLGQAPTCSGVSYEGHVEKVSTLAQLTYLMLLILGAHGQGVVNDLVGLLLFTGL